VIKLNEGDPDFETPQHVRSALFEAVEAGHTHYVDSMGDPELRAALAADLLRRTGVSYAPEQVLITHGGSGGLAATILATVDPGDRVVLPEPTYSLYADLVALAGGQPAFCRLRSDDFHLDLDAIERVARGAKLLVICNPSNPTGAVYRRDELENLANLAERHDLLVLSDEAYDHIVYDNFKFVSMLDLPALRDRLIYCQTFSKVLAMTGWRIGYLAAPQAVIEAAARMHRTLVGSLNAAVQRAALVAVSTPTDWPERMRQEYQHRRDLVIEMLDGVDGINVLPPEGTFYAFVGSTSGVTSARLTALALKHGVAVRSGAEFGPSGEGYIRLAFSTETSQLKEGLSRLRDMFTSLTK
jgi:aspartate aminotransferase